MLAVHGRTLDGALTGNLCTDAFTLVLEPISCDQEMSVSRRGIRDTVSSCDKGDAERDDADIG